MPTIAPPFFQALHHRDEGRGEGRDEGSDKGSGQHDGSAVDQPTRQLCNLVTIFGKARQGKSTLMNVLTGQEVSCVHCVTPASPQSTEHTLYDALCY
jgi:hypothetical protein